MLIFNTFDAEGTTRLYRTNREGETIPGPGTSFVCVCLKRTCMMHNYSRFASFEIKSC